MNGVRWYFALPFLNYRCYIVVVTELHPEHGVTGAFTGFRWSRGEKDGFCKEVGMSQKTEQWWEKKLGIETGCYRDRFLEEACNPYEPTDYRVLERLAGSGYVTQESHFLDYGCGLGRSLFYMAARTGCRATGVEFDPSLCENAENNLARAKLPEEYKKGIRIVCADARNYRLEDEDCIYFFNPFANEILEIVLEKIRQSCFDRPRQMYLFFYYPFDEEVAALMTADGFTFVDEIDCTDLYEYFDLRERILVYEAG